MGIDVKVIELDADVLESKADFLIGGLIPNAPERDVAVTSLGIVFKHSIFQTREEMIRSILLPIMRPRDGRVMRVLNELNEKYRGQADAVTCETIVVRYNDACNMRYVHKGWAHPEEIAEANAVAAKALADFITVGALSYRQRYNDMLFIADRKAPMSIEFADSVISQMCGHVAGRPGNVLALRPQ